MDFLCPSSIIEAVLIRLADLTQVILNLQSWKLDFLDKIKEQGTTREDISFFSYFLLQSEIWYKCRQTSKKK